MDIGSKFSKPTEWHENKEKEMKKILQKKADVSQSFRNALQKAVGKTIIEDTAHVFWGRGTKQVKGENKMGLLLMNLTKDLFGGESEPLCCETDTLRSDRKNDDESKSDISGRPAEVRATQSIPTISYSKQPSRFHTSKYRKGKRNAQKNEPVMNNAGNLQSSFQRQQNTTTNPRATNMSSWNRSREELMNEYPGFVPPFVPPPFPPPSFHDNQQFQNYTNYGGGASHNNSYQYDQACQSRFDQNNTYDQNSAEPRYLSYGHSHNRW